jgi:hypothetical protein
LRYLFLLAFCVAFGGHMVADEVKKPADESPAADEKVPVEKPADEAPKADEAKPEAKPDATEAAPQKVEKVVALVGGRVVTMSSSGVLDGATVLITGDKISAIGKDVAIPDNATRIDVTGMTVAPGLIDSRSSLWLATDSISASASDGSLKAIDAVDPFSDSWMEVSRQGVTAVSVQPSGSLGGQSVVLRVAPAASVAELVIKENAAVQASLGLSMGLWRAAGDPFADEAEALAGEFARSIRASIDAIPPARAKGAIPAAPGRRMDAGAIGSMVADYPLQLHPPGESRLMKTADFLIEHCFHQGGFFQEMIHSGINAYLTLDLAQTLLRAGDPRFADLIRRVAELASPTGQWPEAIHPRTLGGCMGDGQHGWAAGEWLMLMRNCFVREEAHELILASGILPEWLAAGSELRFGPTLTAWGPVSVRLFDSRLFLEAAWRGSPPRMTITVPGFATIHASPSDREFHLLPS